MLKDEEKARSQLVPEVRALRSKPAKLEPVAVKVAGAGKKERTIAQDRPEELSHLNQILLDSLPCVAFLLRPGSREIVASNKAAKEIGAVPGTRCYEAWARRDTPCPWCLAPEVWKTGQDRHLQVEYEGKWWEVHWLAISDELYMQYVFDITESKAVEMALVESEQRYRAAFEQAMDSMLLVDTETGRIGEFNDKACENLGYSRQEFEKLKLSDIEAVESDREIIKHLDKVVGEGSDVFETQHRTKSGEILDVLVSAKIISVHGRKVCQAIFRDITERKKAEQALQESEERYRSFVQNFRGIAFGGKMDFTPVFFHGSVKEITGYTEEEFIDGNPRWDQVIHPDDLSAIFTDGEKKLHSVRNFSCEREYRIVRKDGGIRWVHEVIQNVCDKCGKPTMVQGAIYDITERKRAEEALLFTRFSVDNAVDTMVCVDHNGHFIDVNNAFCRISGYSREELLSMTVHDVDPDYSAEIWPEFWEKLKQSGSLTFESCHRTKEGKVFPVEITANYFEYNGKEYHCSFARDITERKQAEEKLRKYQHQLKTMAWQLSRVQEQERRNLAVEMHDRVSQRLAMAKVNVQILAQSSGDAEVSGKLRSTAEEIGQVIEDAYSLMLELSNPVLYEIGLKAAVEALLKDKIGPEHGIEYELAADDDLKLDDVIKVPVYQAVRELLTNVIKHSRANKLVVDIHRTRDAVQVVVEDNGVGFDVTRTGAPAAGREGGFGLFGIRENLEYINGNLEVKSKQGKGTVAIVTAPLEYKAEPGLKGQRP